MALQWAQMGMVRWMCAVKLQDRVPSKGLRERLGLDDISRYYSKTGCDGMGMCCQKKTMIEVEGARSRGRPKKTWREIVEKGCQARKLNRGCHGL